MNYYMTPHVVVYLKIVGSGTERILLDTVAGIMYEAQGGKIPVFSHHSIEFDAIAEGKSLVSGLLVVNKGYKDMIAGIITGLSQGIKGTTEASKDANKKANSQEKQDENALVYDFINRILAYPKLYKDFVASNPITNANRAKEFVQINSYVPLRSALWDVNILNVMIAALTTDIQDGTEVGLSSNYIDLYKDILTEIENNIKPEAQLVNIMHGEYEDDNNTDNKDKKGRLINERNEQLIKAIEDNSKHIKDEINTIKGRTLSSTNDIIREISELSTQVSGVIPKIYGSDLFNSLRKQGYTIQLTLQFGTLKNGGEGEGNHEVVINDCYFASESLNISVDNRDNIKESYSFIAKSIS